MAASVVARLARRWPALRPVVESEIARQLATGAAGTFGLKVLGIVFSFATTILLARVLNADGYGVYAYAVSWATLLFVPSMLGMDTLLVRDIAAYGTVKDWPRMRGLLVTSLVAVAVTSVGIAVAAGALLEVARVTPDALSAVLLGLLLVPLMALTRTIGAALRGLHKVVAGQLPELALRPVLLLALLVGGAWLLARDFGPPVALGAYLIAAIVALVVAVGQLWRYVPAPARAARPRYELRRWAISALPLLLIGGLGVVNTQTDIVLLGALRGPSDAGIYRVASRGAEFIEFVLLAVNAPLAPMMARIHARGETPHLQRLLTSSARLVALLSAPIAVGLILFGDVYLGLFGQSFLAGRQALTLLAAAQMVNAFFGSVGMALTMTGHERDALRGLLLAAILNVALNVALIPSLGTVGAAIATGTSIVAWNVVLGALLFRRLGLLPTALGDMIRLGQR